MASSSSSNPRMIKECHVESKVKEYHVGDKELKLHPSEKEYKKLAVEKPSAKMRKTEEAFILNESKKMMLADSQSQGVRLAKTVTILAEEIVAQDSVPPAEPKFEFGQSGERVFIVKILLELNLLNPLLSPRFNSTFKEFVIFASNALLLNDLFYFFC